MTDEIIYVKLKAEDGRKLVSALEKVFAHEALFLFPTHDLKVLEKFYDSLLDIKEDS